MSEIINAKNIFIGIVISVFIFFSSCLLLKQNDMLNKQVEIEKSIVEQKQLADNIIRSMAQYATQKDIEKFAKDSNLNLDIVRKDLEKLNADISGISKTTVISAGYSLDNKGSDYTVPRVDPVIQSEIDCKENCFKDLYGFFKNTQVLKLNEKFNNIEVPFGEAKFSAWKQNPWDLTVNQRNYGLVTVIGTDQDGRNYFYNKFTVDVDGKQYQINIDKSIYMQEFPESKFSFLNPRLFLAFDNGVSTQGKFDSVPNINVGLISYGKTKIQPTWNFLQVGVGYGIDDKKVKYMVTPASYNLGTNINFLKNSYIGPSVSFTKDGDTSFLLSYKVGL